MNKLYTAQEIADKLKIKKTTVYEPVSYTHLAIDSIMNKVSIGTIYLHAQLIERNSTGPAPHSPAEDESSGFLK